MRKLGQQTTVFNARKMFIWQYIIIIIIIITTSTTINIIIVIVIIITTITIIITVSLFIVEKIRNNWQVNNMQWQLDKIMCLTLGLYPSSYKF